MNLGEKLDKIIALLEKLTVTTANIDEQLAIVVLKLIVNKKGNETIPPEDYE